MRKVNSKVRVRESLYKPSDEIEKCRGKIGIIKEDLGKREETLSGVLISRYWYSVEFPNGDIIEITEDMLDKRYNSNRV